jgi:hypothetical protein
MDGPNGQNDATQLIIDLFKRSEELLHAQFWRLAA